MRASNLKAKDNRLSYSEHYTKTFDLLHLLLIQKITTDTGSLNASFSEELKLQIENQVYSETRHD